MQTIDLTFEEPTSSPQKSTPTPLFKSLAEAIEYLKTDPIITPETLSQQIILINNGRKSNTHLIFSPFNRLTGYNPLVENTFFNGHLRQVFIPYSIEVVDYVLELFKNTRPADANFINSNWDPGFDQGDSNPNSIIGNDAIVEDTITKLKNSEYVDFNCMCNGSFTMHFSTKNNLPAIEILWYDEVYIPDEDWIITGEVEVGIFYQILRLYRKVVDLI